MNRLVITLLITLLSATAVSARTGSRLVRHGERAQLEVDGKPFFIIGGETGNSMASCDTDITDAIRIADETGFNTVLIPASWELIEREKGQFDFSQVDTIISRAAARRLRVVLLWFGAWKNSMSCYAPEWFKRDTATYPRARTASGKPLEIASAFSPDVYEADAAAFRRLLRHIADTDTAGTVIMLQIENEIGMLEDPRDHSPLAEKEYSKGVPQALMKHLSENKASLHPFLLRKWSDNGLKTGGSWTEVFGADIFTDEIFMAYNYALYVERLAREARRIFPTMPLYVNAAMNSRGRMPGEYPSAGPLIHLKDIWHAAAPTIDFLSPDLYDRGFTGWVESYATPDNPLFIPEIKAGPENLPQACYVLGEKGAIGLSPFAYNRQSPDPTRREAYIKLRSLTPLMASHIASKDMNGLYFDADSTTRTIIRDGLRITASHYFTLPWDPRAGDGSTWPAAGGIILPLGPMEYIIAGTGIVLAFEPAQAARSDAANLGEDGFLNAAADRKQTAAASSWKGPRIGLASVREVAVSPDGSLTTLRTFNGDETHQGRHVRIGIDDFSILHVKLYEYE